MRILVHDYAGHEFPVHLSKELVRKGHTPLHTYCASNVTPHADFASAEASGVELHPIDLGHQFEKHRPLRRALDEINYGIRSAAQLRSLRPERLIAAQVPVISLLIIQVAAALVRVPMVLWLQDIQGEIAQTQSKRAGQLLSALERRALRRSKTIVTISDEMATIARAASPEASIHVIENWADTDKIKPGPKANAWSIDHGCDQSFNFVYSGTLGVKHRPEALAALAKSLAEHSNVHVIVVSQGAGTDALAAMVAAEGLENVTMLPLQPAEDLPNVLATADVMVALLEPGASAGCVPSKILAYLAAGRPTLALFPSNNLAARIINHRSEAGLAVESIEELTAAADCLRRDAAKRAAMGHRARAYAEAAFDISVIADRFEAILQPNLGEHHADTN